MNIKMYNIDLTVTANCNFNCSYCFEHNHFENKNFKDTNLFFQRIDELLNSNHFKLNYDGLLINFWGGEPTLNEKVIKTIYYYYKNNDKVIFFIYSNGSNVGPFMKILKEGSKNILMRRPKICIQISYDGFPIHDIYRKTKSNRITGEKTRNVIRNLWKNKIPSVIKSTITLDTFKYIDQAREDILNLSKEFPNNDFYKSNKYFPTIDYYHLKQYSEKEIKQYEKELEKVLIKIVPKELEYNRINNKYFFNWFNPGKALCTAGRDMICINWNGNIFKCHGSVYDDDKNKHLLCNLKDENFIKKIEESYKLHNFNFGWEPDECKNCVATFCLRCNDVKFKNSKKSDYMKRWTDYTDQPELCKFYKLNGKIVRAMKRIKRRI